MHLLANFEQEHNIKILLAVNYGSRSLGYASEQSDWDLRFIYVHRPEWYFSLNKQSDVIELMLDDGHIDIEGYDLKKALTLTSKSNPILSDWLHTNDAYIVDKSFLKEMHVFEQEYYNPYNTMHSFYYIAVKNNDLSVDKPIALKSFIYYMRGLLACRWIERNETHPPMNFDELIDVTITDNEEVRALAHDLLAIKRKNKSNDKMIVDERLYRYVADMHRYYEQFLRTFTQRKSSDDLSQLAKFLMDTSMRNFAK